MIRRVYVDTSVIGGYFDNEFSEDTVPFFDRVKSGEVKIIVSDLLMAELVRAPDFVRNLIPQIDEKQTEKIYITEDVLSLADAYIEAKVVGRTSRADCQHIALATISKADVLISWNFKHIVNLEKIIGYNTINLRFGYPTIEIRTPKEILKYGND